MDKCPNTGAPIVLVDKVTKVPSDNKDISNKEKEQADDSVVTDADKKDTEK